MPVINKHHGNIPPGAIYIGRGSRWGNPFSHLPHARNTILVKTRDEACDKHEAWLRQEVKEGRVTLEDLAALHGETLVCYCAPQRCHGHTLEKMAAVAVKLLAQQPKEQSSEFKMIVAGGRDFVFYEEGEKHILQLAKELPDHLDISIVSGMARGADMVGYHFAKNYGVQCYEFPADWDTHGKRAGFIRNEEMARFSDGLLAFWDGKSRGTEHMINYMHHLGKPVHIVYY